MFVHNDTSNITNAVNMPLENSFILLLSSYMGFPGGSVDKESACNAGDPGSYTLVFKTQEIKSTPVLPSDLYKKTL